jgi:hypothetical protein
MASSLNDRWKQNIPVSLAWLNQLESMGAEDVFDGPLRSHSKEIHKPFWCRQIQNILDQSMITLVEQVKPAVMLKKKDKSPYTQSVTRHNYYTAAWSRDPCTCRYSYAGWTGNDTGVIGADSPPLYKYEEAHTGNREGRCNFRP